MKLTGLFKRGAACLCTAAILMGGVSAFALSPALPDEPAPAELSVTNAVSEAQLRSALSKLTVTYDSEAEGWQIDSPYEEASMEKASCGLYPYLFVTNDDPTVYLSLGMTYFGNKKLDMKSVRVETEDNYYDFTCDEEFIGGYDNDLKAWFDYVRAASIRAHKAKEKILCRQHFQSDGSDRYPKLPSYYGMRHNRCRSHWNLLYSFPDRYRILLIQYSLSCFYIQ